MQFDIVNIWQLVFSVSLGGLLVYLRNRLYTPRRWIGRGQNSDLLTVAVALGSIVVVGFVNSRIILDRDFAARDNQFIAVFITAILLSLFAFMILWWAENFASMSNKVVSGLILIAWYLLCLFIGYISYVLLTRNGVLEVGLITSCVSLTWITRRTGLHRPKA
jgi:hypothetical protein